MNAEFNVKIKYANQTKEVVVHKEMTIGDVKNVISAAFDIPSDEQKLVFKGKILKDEHSVANVGMEADDSIHMVRNKKSTGTGYSGGSTPTGPSQTTTNASQNANADPFAALGGLGGLGGLEGLDLSALGGLGGMGGPGLGGANVGEMLNNPMMQQMMQQMFSNPQALRQMIDSNPQLSAMVNSNPQMRAALENPQMLQMMSQMMSNPQMMQNLGAFGGLGGFGGGLGGLQAGTNTGGSGSQGNSTAGTGTGNQQMPDLSALLGQLGGGPGGQGQQPDLNALLGQLGGGGQLPPGLMGLLNPNAGGNQGGDPNLPPAERYASQLQQMSDMGFTNQELNIQMLDASGGNVQIAIERLLGMLG